MAPSIFFFKWRNVHIHNTNTKLLMQYAHTAKSEKNAKHGTLIKPKRLTSEGVNSNFFSNPQSVLYVFFLYALYA